MASELDPASRPSKLSTWVHLITLALLGLSILSGILVWRGLYLQQATMETPTWLRSWVVVHGALNPFLCGLFGYLACQHIRLGWALRANLVSGFIMEGSFLLLILTGAGLYYVGMEPWRERLEVGHRALGVLLPVSLILHWVMAKRWVRRVTGGDGAG